MIAFRHSLSILIFAATSIVCVRGADDAPPKALRVVASGNSFSGGSAGMFDEIVRLAGIKGAGKSVYSGIGGSRVVQHWDLPGDKNVAKKALLEGNTDVMTMNPISSFVTASATRCATRAGSSPPWVATAILRRSTNAVRSACPSRLTWPRQNCQTSGS